MLNGTEELLYYNRRIANAYLNLHKLAIQDFSIALEINSNRLETLLYRGYSYKKLLNYKMAIADYNQAINIDNKNYFPYLALADLFVETNKFKKAIENYKFAKELNPSLNIDDKIKICQKYS